MYLRKIFTLMCVSCFLISIMLGCSSTSTGDKATEVPEEKPEEVNKEEEQGEEVTAKKYDKKFKYTTNYPGVDQMEADEYYNYVLEKFNIEIEWLSHTFGERDEKVRIWVAAGDMPDVMFWDLQGGKMAEYAEWSAQGQFKALPDDWSKWPNLAKHFDTLQTDEYFVCPDGKLYALPVMRDNVIDGKFIGNIGFLYRADWAQAVGLKTDDNTYTYDEWVEMLRKVIKEDPGGNGPGKTIGIACVGWAFPGALQKLFLKPVDVTKPRVWQPATEEYKKFVVEMKRLYDEGIFWKDQITADDAAASEKFKAGQLTVYYENLTPAHIKNINEGFVKANPDVDPKEAIQPCYVRRPSDGKIPAGATPDYWSVFVFRADLPDEKMERWFDLLDWILSDEGQMLNMYGFEGKDYVIADGEVKVKWPDTDGDGLPNAPHKKSLYKTLTRYIRLTEFFADPEIPKHALDKAFGIQKRYTQEDVLLFPWDGQMSLYGGEAKQELVMLEDEVRAKIIDLLVNSKDIEADWDAFIASKKSVAEDILYRINKDLGLIE